MASVYFDGIEDLTRLAVDLSVAGARALPLATVAVTKTAVEIAAAAKAPRDQGGAPRATGNLANSIGWEVHSGGGAVEAEVGPTADYGGFVEYGTSRMAPQPYMGPAFDRCSPGLAAALAIAASSTLGEA